MVIGKRATTKLVFASIGLAVLLLGTAAKCTDSKTGCLPPPGHDNTCPNVPDKPNSTPVSPDPSLSIIIRK
jgi:hypothetical protein